MELAFFIPETITEKFSPLILSPVPAGQPHNVSNEDDWLDLNDYVRRGSDQIFYITVTGDSMIEYGIKEGDLLVADRLKQPRSGDVVIAEINGSFTVKRFMNWRRELYLVPENPAFKTREVNENEDFAVWGVVTHVLHRF
ncbi:MAG TPA: S24 family peptidase [Pyrinomonadaceae bacterium]|jgi:DNA polymerase V|nr:S24 family peptidase [Pyrinomonadaceae bacterium]